VKSANLALAFLLELALLAALAYWGYRLDAAFTVRWLAAIGAPALLALIWGLVAAPTAKRRLPPAQLVGFKLLVFTLGSGCLWSSGQYALAIALELVAFANLGLSIAWRSV
jgi:Protein of unknown function (DUF2568)